jgi:hypothetical protein
MALPALFHWQAGLWPRLRRLRTCDSRAALRRLSLAPLTYAQLLGTYCSARWDESGRVIAKRTDRTASSMSATTRTTGTQTRRILLGAAVPLSLGMGWRQSLGLIPTPVARDLAVTSFTLAIAPQNIVWGISQAPIGALADRFGLRVTMLICAADRRAGGLRHRRRPDPGRRTNPRAGPRRHTSAGRLASLRKNRVRPEMSQSISISYRRPRDPQNARPGGRPSGEGPRETARIPAALGSRLRGNGGIFLNH